MTTLDPVQGLVDYVLDVKPYHTKIMEVLVEYIHSDPINVTITDSIRMNIDLAYPVSLDSESLNPCTGFGEIYDSREPKPIIVGVNQGLKQFSVVGDYTDIFLSGYLFSVENSAGNNGSYTTVSSTITGVGILQQTVITVAEVIPSAIADGNIFSTSTTYYAIVQLDGSNNSVSILNDHTTEFFAGSLITLAGTMFNNGKCLVISSAFLGGYTILSLAQNIITESNTGTLKRIVDDGYDNPFYCFAAAAPTQAITIITERLQFGWVVASWFQYLILSVNQLNNTFTVPGNGLVDLSVGMGFRVLSSPGNNGYYTIVSAVYNIGPNTTTITVTPIIPSATPGGVIEPVEAFGMELSFHDYIGVTATESVTGYVLVTSGSLIGAWDYPAWNVGGFDENLGTLINLYGQVV